MKAEKGKEMLFSGSDSVPAVLLQEKYLANWSWTEALSPEAKMFSFFSAVSILWVLFPYLDTGVPAENREPIC